jgi:hypothetical protein
MYSYSYRYRLKYKYSCICICSCTCRCRELSAQKLKENGPVLTELLRFQILGQIPVFYNSYFMTLINNHPLSNSWCRVPFYTYQLQNTPSTTSQFLLFPNLLPYTVSVLILLLKNGNCFQSVIAWKIKIRNIPKFNTSQLHAYSC